MIRSAYDLTYRHLHAPWDIGARQELVELVTSGRIRPCRAIDLGSGTASNCIFLAKRGFDVTGVDFSRGAIELGMKRAAQADVSVKFLLDDLTNLRSVEGTFELLVDYGTLDDLSPAQRDRYVENVLPLTRPGSLFLLYCFEWQPRWYERPFYSRMALDLGEAQRRFRPYFEIELYRSETGRSRLPRGWAVYLMTRKGG